MIVGLILWFWLSVTNLEAKLPGRKCRSCFALHKLNQTNASKLVEGSLVQAKLHIFPLKLGGLRAVSL